MSRDHRRLRVFHLADVLVVEVYKRTRGFPEEERYGLVSQVRRAAVSVTANLVEGCTRQTTRDYLRFVTIALGSASEARYLLSLAHRLGMLSDPDCNYLDPRYRELVCSLQSLLDALTT